MARDQVGDREARALVGDVGHLDPGDLFQLLRDQVSLRAVARGAVSEPAGFFSRISDELLEVPRRQRRVHDQNAGRAAEERDVGEIAQRIERETLRERRRNAMRGVKGTQPQAVILPEHRAKIVARLPTALRATYRNGNPMEMTGEQLIPVSQAEVWRGLNDPEVLKACIAGCEAIERVSDTEYRVVIVAAVGPVKAKFNGKLILSDLNPPNSYSLSFEGSGGPAGLGQVCSPA